MSDLKFTELIVFTLLLGAVTIVGLSASRWRRPANLNRLDEWGLGGRQYGPWAAWFVVGGDLYTAYAFVAVPALAFTAGAAAFFVVPYLVVVFPLMLLPLSRLWSVSRARGYLTTADFVRGRYGSPVLALVVAVAGIAATVPYLALQLVALESVMRTMGINGVGFLGYLPLLLAFVVLALFTYRSGLRAPALIAFVKDILIFLVVFVAVLYLPIKLGGWQNIFDAADAKFSSTGSTSDGLLLNSTNQLQYATLAFGSALALFLYPHAVTGVFACRSRDVVRRNMCALPVYTLLLGLLVLLGYAGIAAGIRPLTDGGTGQTDTNTVIPVLFDVQFPDWFAGLTFAAIAIAALVPAAIMAIGAANLWARSIYRHYLHRNATPEQEARQARMASLAVLLGAVVFVVTVRPEFSLDLQLIGGVVILQTLPAVLISLYGRWLHVYGLILGSLAGISYAMFLLHDIVDPETGRRFAGTAYPVSELQLLGSYPFAGEPMTIYVGFVALVFNLTVAVVITVLARVAGIPNGRDETRPPDYVDEREPVIERITTL
jgi:solute:Na+ symporter, SSS family